MAEKARVRTRIPVTPVELSINQRSAAGQVRTEVKAADAQRLRAQGGNSTDRLVSRPASQAQSEMLRGKAIVGGASTVLKRAQSESAKRTPGRNSTGRIVSVPRGISAPDAGPRKRFKAAFQL